MYCVVYLHIVGMLAMLQCMIDCFLRQMSMYTYTVGPHILCYLCSNIPLEVATTCIHILKVEILFSKPGYLCKRKFKEYGFLPYYIDAQSSVDTTIR